jgi:hypothetical protein
MRVFDMAGPGQSGRIDLVENRLERIEQRLDLRDA